MIVSRPRDARLGVDFLTDDTRADIRSAVEQGARDGIRQGINETMSDPATAEQLRALLMRTWAESGPRLVAEARSEFLAPLKTTAIVLALLGTAGGFALAASRR